MSSVFHMCRKQFALCAVTLMAGTTASAATLSELEQTIANPAPGNSDFFGVSVDVDAGTVIVGASGNDAGASNSGSAYVFDTSTGGLLRTFHNPDPDDADSFGQAVAIEGSAALIGAYSDDTGAAGAGSAYLFDVSTGGLLHTFNNPDPDATDFFGRAVALDNGQSLIGAEGESSNASDSGAAYLFDNATGNLTRTFDNPDADAGDNFGTSVALHDGQALIGAELDDTGATDAGSAYLFDTATGALLQTFNNPDAATSDKFGNAVALDDGVALIGAFGDNAGAVNAGAAYLFDTVTGALLQTFLNPTPAFSEFFGYSLSLSNGIAMISAYEDSGAETAGGAVYLFDILTGNLLDTIFNPGAGSDDRFGYALALDGTDAVIGSVLDDTGNENSGTTYVYSTAPLTAPVPLPASFVLLGCAIVGLGARARRRKST